MERIPSSPPPIKPLADSPDRPTWSVMIPVYNCACFLAETLESVLAQHIPARHMQIEVVDDASTDADVERIVREVGKGRIQYYRQPQNVGSLRNFETCINRAQGRLLHILHGDDRVIKGYYRAIEALFEQYPEAGAAFCRYRYINEAGKVMAGMSALEMPHSGLLSNWLLRIASGQRLQYVTMTVKREVYEKLGSFYGKTYGEDWEMWVRIAKHYPVAYTPELLAEYRKHDDSISAAKILTGEYLQDVAFLIDLIQHHVPPQHRKKTRRLARQFFARYGVSVAAKVWQTTQNRKYVFVNLVNVFRLHVSPGICYGASKVLAKMVINYR
ncbi:glycosyltransferase family 2 protein [Pontibacter mangrovi]|uniref:Glycosyltransferase n=1 Tax=Pontibacter mangrovi TaxID=2589816 RepID=A0A501W5Y0_9BACT|nr:glycosyltransferase [Pontibacter mangrovi]TPE43494.1 glycosyltransferase [Pontibacter mangrovi]